MYSPFLTVALTVETPPSVTTLPFSSMPAPSIAMLCGVPEGLGDSSVSDPGLAVAAEAS